MRKNARQTLDIRLPVLRENVRDSTSPGEIVALIARSPPRDVNSAQPLSLGSRVDSALILEHLSND